MSNQFFADEFYVVHLGSSKLLSLVWQVQQKFIRAEVSQHSGSDCIMTETDRDTPHIHSKCLIQGSYKASYFKRALLYQCQRLQDSSAKWALLNGILSDSPQIWSQSKYNQLRKSHMPVYYIMYHIITIIYHLFPCLWYHQLGFMEGMICILP